MTKHNVDIDAIKLKLFKKDKQIPIETNLSLGQLMKAIAQEAGILKSEGLIDHLEEALSSIIKASNTGDVDSEQAIRLLVAYEIIENVKHSL